MAPLKISRNHHFHNAERLRQHLYKQLPYSMKLWLILWLSVEENRYSMELWLILCQVFKRIIYKYIISAKFAKFAGVHFRQAAFCARIESNHIQHIGIPHYPDIEDLNMKTKEENQMRRTIEFVQISHPLTISFRPWMQQVLSHH
ncbi:hypothetical protein AMTR_s00131p00075120 [Amborella trichopoda]|uniref:Uncharacterized protein n=1 Tax=Amborella trichopoda TaxID=13333 RepID=W1NVY2_AMBTC|nr:hypothetical protein AMTR_s00131p00075120 [Amborella trichopoda]